MTRTHTITIQNLQQLVDWRDMMRLECCERGWSEREPGEHEILMERRHYLGRERALQNVECPPDIRVDGDRYFLMFRSEGDLVLFDLSC